MSLYAEMFYSQALSELFSEKNTIAKMLRVEAALAQAQARNGHIPQAAADCIAECCQLNLIDLAKLKSDIPLSGNAAIPLVKQLTQLVQGKDAAAAKYVHFGATSQDVVDTATVLQIQKYLDWLETQISILSGQLIGITRKHRDTLMAGRTLLQQARPITFGLKTAGWLESVARSQERLAAARNRVLRIQLAGAVGSGNAQISATVQHTFAQILNLQPGHSWHTQRDNLAELAAVLGILSGSLAKIAQDVMLLMQTEIGEVFEGAAPGKGGSSTMPHKRNPVTCAAILANTHRIPQLVASMLAGMPQPHERAAGLWQAEWETLPEIMQRCAGAVELSAGLVAGLEVDKQRMLSNLELTRGLIYAENVSLALAPLIGKAQAHDIVEKACRKAQTQQKHLKVILLEDLENVPGVHLSSKALDDLFKPENSIGSSLEIIDDILEKFGPA